MRTILTAVFMITVLFFVDGCKKQSSPPPKPANSVSQTQPAAPAVAPTGEQTICPVMAGNPIDKNVFVEYKGKKVYFCCTQCKGEFEKNPEKYLSKLPQFAK
jgi:YHS domain-containing protein